MYDIAILRLHNLNLAQKFNKLPNIFEKEKGNKVP